MNSRPTLHGGFSTSPFTPPTGSGLKLDKKVYFTMKWVGRDKCLTGGVCPSMQWVVWGSALWAGLDHMSSFQPFVPAGLRGNCISWGHCVWELNGPYIHCGAVTAGQQKQIDTYRPRPHLARMTHLQWTKKDILVCWKSWEKIGYQGDGAVKHPQAIKLQSDVNVGRTPGPLGPLRRWAPFTRRTQIKRFVCQFTCHLNGLLFIWALFE